MPPFFTTIVMDEDLASRLFSSISFKAELGWGQKEGRSEWDEAVMCPRLRTLADE